MYALRCHKLICKPCNYITCVLICCVCIFFNFNMFSDFPFYFIFFFLELYYFFLLTLLILCTYYSIHILKSKIQHFLLYSESYKTTTSIILEDFYLSSKTVIPFSCHTSTTSPSVLCNHQSTSGLHRFKYSRHFL